MNSRILEISLTIGLLVLWGKLCNSVLRWDLRNTTEAEASCEMAMRLKLLSFGLAFAGILFCSYSAMGQSVPRPDWIWGANERDGKGSVFL